MSYYPDCPEERKDCRFVDHGATATLMASPIVYDKDGNPVAGGANKINRLVQCYACHRCFVSSASELQDAQGLKRDWKELE